MPNSLVWIGLVVVWIFVLFPMVTGRRTPVRRTGEATLATRVLHRGGMARPRRRGPAAGHAGDPQWKPTEEQERARHRHFAHPDTTRAEAQMDSGTKRSADRDADEDILDAEVVEVTADEGTADSGGRSAGASEERMRPRSAAHGTSGGATASAGARESGAEETAEAREEPADGSEADAARSGAEEPETAAPQQDDGEAPAEAETVESAPVVHKKGRGGFDPQADAIASAQRYRTRQRVVLSLAGGVLVTLVAALMFTSVFWWGTAVFAVALGVYMGYLRRQVRIEQEIRRRRMARLQRSRKQAQADRRVRATVPGPPRRRNVTVLEADDGDPAFEHLPPYRPAERENLRHASGQ